MSEPAIDASALKLDVGEDGIARLTFDRPDSKQNILTSGVMQRLSALLDEVADGARNARVRALVIRSGKPRSFIAGADIDEIAGLTDASEAERGAREGQKIFRKIERLPVPSIVEINGVCLGGGTELSLACSYRIAADAAEVKI